MLDTVILQVPQSQYRILKKERFHLVGAKPTSNGFIVCRTYANNATAAEKKALIYRPRLTLVEQAGRENHLKIEFSAQTILFGNTLREVSDGDFENELTVLEKSVSKMGVAIPKEFLRCAVVSAFHPAKNIPITGGYSAMGIIRDFTKINLTEKMEIDFKDFKNGGHGVQFRAESHALTFYDKIKDLEKGEKKAYSSDQKIQQTSLFDFMQQKREPEVMRMETRLCQKPKMNSVLKQLGFGINPTFADIFKEDVCRKVLLHYFATYIDSSLFVFTLDDTPQGILKSILRKNKKMKIDEAMKLAMLKVFCKDEGGVRGLRNIIEPRAGRRKWQRIITKIKTLNQKISLTSCHGYIRQIKQILQEFKPYDPKVG